MYSVITLRAKRTSECFIERVLNSVSFINNFANELEPILIKLISLKNV